MLRQLRTRLTYANVVATLALFLSLGGGAYAAATIGASDIQSNAIRTGHIKNHEVRSADVRNHTLLGRDVANNSLTGADVRESSLGQVPSAAKLDGKDPGQLGVNGLERVTGTSATDSNSSKSANASCPAGKKTVGTGADIYGGKSGGTNDVQTNVVIDRVGPNISLTTVIAQAYEDESTNASWRVTANAICATAP